MNLTDGLDGLATGAAVLVLAAYVLIGDLARAQRLHHVPVQAVLSGQGPAGPGGGRGRRDSARASASCGGTRRPAKIFMGDTGSLALGGVLAGLAVCTKTQLLLVILGGLFVITTLSVIIQVSVFKATKLRTGRGIRVFKMSPLHHHFELIGWAETTIVIRFWLISGLCVALGLGIFYAEWLAT